MVLRYFAYGSNLSIEQMTARAGPIRQGAGRPRVAWLANYRLVFNMQGDCGQAFANLMCPGEGVFGVLYCCTSEALLKMDAHEKGYARGRVRVVLNSGKKVEAVTYFAESAQVGSNSQPSVEYLQKILAGARQHGLPDVYIREIEATKAALAFSVKTAP